MVLEGFCRCRLSWLFSLCRLDLKKRRDRRYASGLRFGMFSAILRPLGFGRIQLVTMIPCGHIQLPSFQGPWTYGSFRKLGVACFGVLIIRILLLRVLY